MHITQCTRQDFDAIITDHGVFWDNDLTFQLHHQIFIQEFGDSAFVIKDDGGVIAAYFLGFISQTGPVGYVHLVATRPEYRGRGFARQLYDHFVEYARSKGCTRLRATAHPENALSIGFHLAYGMTMQGEDLGNGVRVIRNYLRPGGDRVVFEKEIGTKGPRD